MPEVSRLSTEKATAETKPEFLEQLRSLHLSTVEAYQEWCGCHGFSRRIQKTWRERLKERSYFVRAVAESRLAQKRLETRKPDQVIQAILRGDLTESDVTQPHLVEVCRAQQLTKDCERTRKNLLGLLLHARRCADFFGVEPVSVTAVGRMATLHCRTIGIGTSFGELDSPRLRLETTYPQLTTTVLVVGQPLICSMASSIIYGLSVVPGRI